MFNPDATNPLSITEVIKAINATKYKSYITVTGGGTSFIGDYLSISGGSKTILGFFVPYTQQLFDEFIGKAPEKYVSEETARKLAMASYEKASKLVDRDIAIGIGATVSLRTDNEREGRMHRIYVAAQTMTHTISYSVELKMNRSRAEEERIVREIILEILARTAGINYNCEFSLDEEEKSSYIEFLASSEFYKVANNFEPLELVRGIIHEDAEGLNIFCGSFAPWHFGHKAIFDLATDILGTKPVLEISIANVDKPSLDYLEIEKRVNALDTFDVLLTNQPRLINKIKTIHEAYPEKKLTFILGHDTWQRFLHPKYDGSQEEINAAVDFIKSIDVKFLVFSRNGEGAGAEHPAEFRRIVDYRAESFDMPISSTEIRKNTK